MPNNSADHNQKPPSDGSHVACYPWITASLIEHTIRVWSKFYPAPLTNDDAIEILASAGRLIDVLGQHNSNA